MKGKDYFGKTVNGFGALMLGIGTFCLGVATLCKVPEIYGVVNRIKNLDQTVIEVKESTHLTLEVLGKINRLIPFVTEKVSKTKNKEELSGFLKELPESIELAPFYERRGELRMESRLDMNSMRSNLENVKIVETWEAKKTDEEKENYLNAVFSEYFQTGVLNANVKNDREKISKENKN